MFLRNAVRYLLGSISKWMARDVVLTPIVTLAPEMEFRPKRKKAKAKTRKMRRVQLWPRSMTYPHSSTRQQARYARQMAAGQLHFMPVHGVPDRSAA